MRKHHFITSVVIFVAGFALSSAIDGRYLASPAKGILTNPAATEVAAQITQNPSTPQSWEYRVATKYFQPGKKWEVNSELSQFVAQGFEIYSVTQSSPDVGFYLAIVLRRPKQ